MAVLGESVDRDRTVERNAEVDHMAPNEERDNAGMTPFFPAAVLRRFRRLMAMNPGWALSHGASPQIMTLKVSPPVVILRYETMSPPGPSQSIEAIRCSP